MTTPTPPAGASTDVADETPDNLVLAGDFAAPTYDQWAAEVAKVLNKGRPEGKQLSAEQAVERLRFKTVDGIVVEPIYTIDDAIGELGAPASEPFTRGTTVRNGDMDAWDVRALHEDPDPAVTRAAIRTDLERGAITWKGRDWPAPLRAWQVAIDQLLSKRNAATLELPLTGHGYLYAVLAGMADKQEAAAELEREQAARARAHSSAAPTSVADVLLPLPPGEGRGEGQRPAAAPAQPAGTSPTVRAMRAAIERKKGEQP